MLGKRYMSNLVNVPGGRSAISGVVATVSTCNDQAGLPAAKDIALLSMCCKDLEKM
jgi:hypothetical protein